VCHQARAVVAGPNGRRELAVEALFKGPGKSSLDPGELLVAILLPAAQPRSAAKYLRFTPRREMDIAIAGAGTWLRLDADGAIAEARIVLASVGPTPMRAPTAEQRLAGERPTRALLEEAGWDPADRVLSLPACHPLLGRTLCRADGCPATAQGTKAGGLCQGCFARLRRAGRILRSDVFHRHNGRRVVDSQCGGWNQLVTGFMVSGSRRGTSMSLPWVSSVNFTG
jgi:hypothetical protein